MHLDTHVLTLRRSEMADVEITVVDSSGGAASYWAQRTYPGALLAGSVWEMVDGILRYLSLSRSDSDSDPVAIRLLRIVGHGSPGRQGMGDSRFTSNRRQIIGLDRHGILLNRAVLIRLRGCFSENARVELHGCNVGAGTEGATLLEALRGLWGVRIRASSVVQDAGTPGLDVFAHF